MNKDDSILEIACGAGGMLYHLYNAGFKDLSGYDYDSNAVNCAKEICKTVNYDIDIYQDDATAPSRKKILKDAIVWVNGMYHLQKFTLDKFFDLNTPCLKQNGVIAFDMVDKSFNSVPNNEFCTQDVGKPISERRPSEYMMRFSKSEIVQIARKYGLHLIKYYPLVKEPIPRCVYIFRK